MKIHALNISRTHGISCKKVAAGKPYDMANMQFLVPFEPGGGDTKDGGHYERLGYGMQVGEIGCRNDCIDQFKDVQFPAQVEVSTDSEMVFGRMQTVVTGLIVKKAA